MSAGTQIDFSKYETLPATTGPQIDFSKYETSTAAAAPQTTIGPQSTAGHQPQSLLQSQIMSSVPGAKQAYDIADKLKEWAGMTQEGQQQHPAQAAAGQFADRLKQMLVGGQGGGLNMQTGFLTNPVTGSIVGGPGEATAAAGGLEKAGQAASEAGQAISEAMPAAKMAAARQQFQQLSGALGNHTVAMTDRLGNAMDAVKQAADTGSTLPSVINKFVTRIADVDKGPLTYDEARQFYHNVSELSATEKMAAKPSDLRLIQEFKHSLGETIGNTADQAGQLQKYQQAMQGFAQGAQGQARLQQAKDLALKVGGEAVLGAAGLYGAKKLYDIFGPR